MELFLAERAIFRKIPTDNDGTTSTTKGCVFVFLIILEGLRFQCYFYFTCNGTSGTAKGYSERVLTDRRRPIKFFLTQLFTVSNNIHVHICERALN